MFNDSDIKNIFGLVVKELRLQKGLTQEKLAEFLGMQPQTIAKIETGKRFVSSEVLAKLCNFFNVEPYVFFVKKNQTFTPETLDHISQINCKLDKIYEVITKK
ncbi:MAG: helix-turn-helix transcriptional regulator [Candidatus Gastranaerophilales bacterium]|nr:helix-turn-helix transcriptional regulator [Candidatus Gastranaerophilales bacterium]